MTRAMSEKSDKKATVKAARSDILDDPIVGRPKKVVDAAIAYFWTEEWQDGERAASAQIAKGQTKRFRSAEALIRDLNR